MINKPWLQKIGLLFLTSFLSLVVLIPAGTARALSQDDLNSIIGETPFYQSQSQNCSSSSSSLGTTFNQGAVTLNGNNPKIAFDFFTSEGYTAQQAAGIDGNLMYESGGVNPTQEEIGGGGGYGIAQFTGAELTNLKTWATANGQDYTTLQAQLNYLQYDLNNNESAAGQAVKATSTVADAAQAFMINYERPADPTGTLQPRVTDAQAAFALYAGSSGAITSSCDTSGTSPSCQSATGDAEILCVAKQYAGIYYLWGGGHDGYDSFRAACPVNDVASAASFSSAGNPGPCATDCSGLVSVAVDQAFNLSFDWTVAGTMNGDGSQYWQQIPMNQVQPGDIVTTPEHVEIVDHYDSSTQTIYTFGSHETGTKTGPASAVINTFYTAAYHWVGPGSQNS